MPDLFGDGLDGLDDGGAAAQSRQPIDFVGINYYLRLVARDDPSGGPRPGAGRAAGQLSHTRQWTGKFTHRGLRKFCSGWSTIRQRTADTSPRTAPRSTMLSLPNGHVDDVPRVEYLQSHLRAARQAIETGVDLRGYFVWSLLDNFEWQSGFSKRFGIVRVDFETQQRVPKIVGPILLGCNSHQRFGG